MSRPLLSTHILDTSTGKPAAGVHVELYREEHSKWAQLNNTLTNGDGRIQFNYTKEAMPEGMYKLKFDVEDYFRKAEKETLYPYIEIIFKVREGEHYHVPLLLTQYGYSTYRGS